MVLILLISVVHVSPLAFEHIDAASSNDDWTQIFAFQAYLADQLLSIGSIPQRSHILGGGFPIIGHPEYPVLSPLILPVWLFGPVMGVRVASAVYFLLGVFGMWSWLRARRFDVEVAAYGTLVYATCGWFVAIMASGNFPQIYYLWLPLWLWLVVPSTPSAPRLDARLILAALLGACALTDGHLNTACTFLVIGYVALTTSRRATERAVLFAIITTGLAAFKLAPTLALLAIEDRSIDIYGAEALETATFSIDLFTSTTGRPEGFPLGWVPWILCLPAILSPRRKDALRMLSILLLAALLWLGPNAPIDLFWVLSRVPILQSIDAPSKYFVFFIGFSAIALGCHGLMAIPTPFRGKAALLLAGLSSGLLIWNGSPEFTRPFDRIDDSGAPPVFLPYEPVDTNYFVSEPWTGSERGRPDLYFYYRAGIPLVRWEDNFQLPTAVVPSKVLSLDGKMASHPAARPLALLENSPVQVDHFSANRIRLSFPQLSEPGQLSINQTADTGWTCDVGTPTPNTKLLELSVPGGSSSVDCHYHSIPLQTGAGITTLTLALLLGFTWRQRRMAT